MQNHIYIAGASSRSRTARVYIEYLNPELKTIAFLVSPEMTDNPDVVDGIPAQKIENGLDVSLPVYLGTRGANHPKLETELRAVGFTDIRPVTMQLDSDLRNAYLEKWYAGQGREFVRMDMLVEDSVKSVSAESKGISGNKAITFPSAAIYVSNSIFDGQLKDSYESLSEEKVIQVGTALTEERLSNASCFDDEGENISDRNKPYCALTGLYWIWKHAGEDYVGLVHYRRHFLLPENWVEICERNDIDVILPVPLYVGPSVAENYRTRHIASDWDFMLSYVKEKLPNEYDDLNRILGGCLYSPCNMLIARRAVLDDLCKWLFPILFAVVEHGGKKDDKYQARYPGFLSERLITYFFESRRDRYHVVYCNKNFLS